MKIRSWTCAEPSPTIWAWKASIDWTLRVEGNGDDREGVIPLRTGGPDQGCPWSLRHATRSRSDAHPASARHHARRRSPRDRSTSRIRNHSWSPCFSLGECRGPSLLGDRRGYPHDRSSRKEILPVCGLHHLAVLVVFDLAGLSLERAASEDRQGNAPALSLPALRLRHPGVACRS